jgi:hypothetical protein
MLEGEAACYSLAIVSSSLYRCVVPGRHKEDRFALFDSLRRRLARFRSNARGMLNLACSLGWIALLTSCKPFENLETFAVVLAVEGNPTVTIPRDSAPQPLTLTTRLPAGSRITTDSTEKAVVRLLPGIHCAIGPDSKVSIEELRFAKSGNDTSDSVDARTSKIVLSRGTLICWVTDRAHEAASRLSIQTAIGTIDAEEDSVFVVKNSGARARAICVQGKIRFTSDGSAGPAEIEEASFYQWPSNGGPGKISSIDDETRADATLALETASSLKRLSSFDEDKLPTR